MKYEKPGIVSSTSDLPSVTMNFSPPAVGANTKTKIAVENYQEEISGKIKQMFGIQPDLNDRRLSASAKQI